VEILQIQEVIIASGMNQIDLDAKQLQSQRVRIVIIHQNKEVNIAALIKDNLMQ